MLGVSPCGLDYACPKNPYSAAAASRRAYIDVASFWNQPARISMAFKPNYGRDRAERARAARAKSEEKQRKKDEKTALRKAAHAESEPQANGSDPLPDEKQS